MRATKEKPDNKQSLKILAEIEKRWEKTTVDYYSVGKDLIRIRDQKLYLARYKSFKDYCTRSNHFGRQRAYQIIEAAQIIKEMDMDDCPYTIHMIERHARELKKCAESPSDRKRVWLTVIERCEANAEEITVSLIMQVAVELLSRKILDSAESSEDKDQEEPEESESEDATKDEPAEVKSQSEVQHSPMAIAESDKEVPAPETAPNPPANVEAETKPTDEPQRESLFDPAKFDPSYNAEPNFTTKGARDYLKWPMESAKLARDIVREINSLEARVKNLSQSGYGYLGIYIPQLERCFSEIRSTLNRTQYECPCPTCKHDVVPTCQKCGGRGFLDVKNANTMSDEEKDWVKKQKAK